MPLAEIESDTAAHDVVFVGTGFRERVELLAAVDWSGIDLGLYGSWDRRQMPHRLRPYVRANVIPNAHAAWLYRQSKIGLNLYRRPPEGTRAESMNPRAYELAACGVFQISDRRAEGVETLSYSVPTFRTPEELGRNGAPVPAESQGQTRFGRLGPATHRAAHVRCSRGANSG